MTKKEGELWIVEEQCNTPFVAFAAHLLLISFGFYRNVSSFLASVTH